MTDPVLASIDVHSDLRVTDAAGAGKGRVISVDLANGEAPRDRLPSEHPAS